MFIAFLPLELRTKYERLDAVEMLLSAPMERRVMPSPGN
jgi:hypothetical protein